MTTQHAAARPAGMRFSRRTLLKLGGAAALAALLPGCGSPEDGGAPPWTFDPAKPFERLDSNPLITTDRATIGDNVNGPTLIRVPDWIDDPLGRYYLYFAHHAGSYIRMAYADDLGGPWTIHAPGTLQLVHTPCYSHIASPDVVLDHDRHTIRMYFHGDVFGYFGLDITAEEYARLPGFLRARLVDPGQPTPDGLDAEFPVISYQRSFVAESINGITFGMVHDEPLGAPYFRTFAYAGYTYALAMPGIMYRSPNGLRDFARGPVLFPESMRHSAVLVSGDTLHVFWTRVGDAPERILRSAIDLTPDDWMQWRAREPITVLQPETDYEGADLPVTPSERGRVEEPAHQLRDPAIYREGDQVYLLYAAAGEQAIAIARQAG